MKHLSLPRSLAALAVALAATLTRAQDVAEFKWSSPPNGNLSKRTPRLVNYCHISSELRRHPSSELARMLARWDVVILYPYQQVGEYPLVTPDQIRQHNPDAQILVWMPLQGPSGPRWQQSISKRNLELWSGRDGQGKVVVAPWGEVLMNPVANNRGWPRHVVSFLDSKCLRIAEDRYDGAMLDCLWPGPFPEIDANQDGKRDPQDATAWRDAYTFMLRELRRKHPRGILVGNGGAPLSAGDAYLQTLNGSMHENALGDQWGRGEWADVWNGYKASVDAARQHNRPAMHLIMVDVRNHRSLEEARDLQALTSDDLRRMRLGLCTSLLLDGGYFGFDRGDCLHGQLWWFDEYDAHIGDPVEPFKEGVFGAGTYSRRYSRGFVVANPSQRPVTVSLSEPHFDYSTRSTASKHVIPPHDGRILRTDQHE